MPTRRILGVLIAIVLSAALSGSVAAAPKPARVAVIVGPAGELTGLYRSIGLDAAREARRWTSDVVTVMTPDATWPAVKRALRGASVVVYLGHGNGFAVILSEILKVSFDAIGKRDVRKNARSIRLRSEVGNSC